MTIGAELWCNGHGPHDEPHEHTRRTNGHRGMRRTVGIFFAIIAVTLAPFGVPSADAASTSLESEFVAAMNAERVSRGLGALTVASDLVDYGRRHSQVMADQSDLHHSSDLRTLTNWELLGENVGRGGSVDALHQAFMDSPGHRENVLRDRFGEVGVGVVVEDDTIWVTVVFRDPIQESESASSATGESPVVGIASTSSGDGYWVARADGSVRRHGDAEDLGSAEGRSKHDVVAMAATPTNHGYWLLDTSGGVYAFGDAGHHGSLRTLRSQGHTVGSADAVAIITTATGDGYWILDEAGGIFTFGDADYLGSLPGLRAAGGDIGPAEVIGMAPTASGDGYWILDSVGGVFTFGDADFRGSIPGLRAAGGDIGPADVIGLAPTESGDGYWVLDDQGGVFTFGDADYLGSLPALKRDGEAPAHLRGVDVSPTPQGDGYWLLGHTGQVFGFGDAG